MGVIKQIPSGTVFGKWTVLGYAGERGKGNNTYWNCRCECGVEKEVCGTSLRKGNSKCITCSAKINGRIGLYTKGRQQHLYMVKCGDYFKIGVSDNPKRRIKDFESSNPFPIEVLYIGENEGHEEELWHNIFAHRHHRGEWFKGVCEII